MDIFQKHSKASVQEQKEFFQFNLSIISYETELKDYGG